MSHEQDSAWQNATGIDSSDLYDHEVKALGKAVKEAQYAFKGKVANRHNLDELEKRIVENCYKIGLLVQVQTIHALMGRGVPEVSVIGKVPGHSDRIHGLDHEKKGWEVNRAVARNEDAKIRAAIREIEPPAEKPAP